MSDPKNLLDIKLTIKITKLSPDKIFINIQNLAMIGQGMAEVYNPKFIIFISIRPNIFRPLAHFLYKLTIPQTS